MPTAVAALVCLGLVAVGELVRYRVARVLRVPVVRVAKCFVACDGGPRWARVAVIAAGTLTVYLGAVAITFALAARDGVPTRYLECTVVEVPAGYPASGKLRQGDVITAIDGEPLDRSPSTLIDQRGGAPVRLTFRRGNTTQDLTLRPIGHDGHWMLGFRPAVHGARSYDPVVALRHAFAHPFAAYLLVLIVAIDLGRALRAITRP